MGLIARFALFLASPDIVRYASELVASDGADYSFWALGPLIPPINPDALEAAAAETTPQLPTGPGAPQNPVPIAVVGVPTEGPPSPTAAPPSPTAAPPSPTPTQTSPAPTAAPPSPAPSRTAAPARAPSSAPTNTARPTSAALTPTSTPVTRPDAPPPSPTNTRAPAQTPLPTATAPVIPTVPVQPPRSTPSPTATRAPTATPAPEEPPTVRFASASRIEAEPREGAESSVSIELVLSKGFSRRVTVPYTVAAESATPGEDYRASNGTVTFEPDRATASLQVTILGDSRNEPNEAFTIRLGSPTNATLTEPTELRVTITDSDAPPTVSFTGSTRTVAEGVGSTAVTIQLSEPSAIDVTVPYVVEGTAGTSDHSLRAGTVVIPAGSSSARLRFNIVADRIDEDGETIGIYLGTPTNAQLGPPSVYFVSITDDDTAGVSIAPVGFELTESRSGAFNATYRVVLESQPVAPVQIDLAPEAGEVIVSPAALTFTAGNWDTPQQVTITTVDDRIDEDGDNNTTAHGDVVRHAVTSADPNYEAFAADDVAISITDDDTAGVSITPRNVSVAEDGATDTYTVTLESQPTSPVTITVLPDDELSAAPTTLTFDATNWNTGRQVTVSAVDDRVDEDGTVNNTSTHSGVLTHAVASADPNYGGFAAAAVTATITDNDTAGVAIAPLTLSLSETPTALNHARQYTVQLTSRPAANVTLTLLPDAQVTVSRASVTFTPSNWNVPVPVTVTAVDDAIDEYGTNNTTSHPGVVRHTVASADPFYDDATSRFTADDVAVTIADNDTAGFLVTPTDLTVTEGLTTTYTVRLTSQPLANVTVSAGAPSDTVAALDKTTLTFTESNWNTPQTVTVTPIDNAIDAPDATFTLNHMAASGDPLYDAAPVPSVAVTVADEDTAGISVSPLNLSLSETTTAGNFRQTYAVSLTSQPVAPVTITVAPDEQILVGAGTSPVTTTAVLTFTTDTWAAAQTVTVQSVDDAFDEADVHTGVLTHALASADPNYDDATKRFTAEDVTATITDNDTAEVIVERLTLSLAEGGPGASYTVRLSSRPRGQVEIALTADSQLSISPATLTFTNRTWATAQTVIVQAVDDALDEAATHSGTVRHRVTNGDQNYTAALVINPVSVQIADNDTAGVVVSPLTLTTTEGGAASYSVRLESQPTAPVTITLGAAPAGRLSLSTTALSFTDLTWSTPQTVTVTALDNSVDAPDATATVTHAVASADPNYAGFPAAPVTATITDDDTAALLIAPTGLSVSELLTAPDHSATYSVRLGSQPTGPITISLGFDAAQLAVAPAALAFTPGDWTSARIVTVTAVDDLVLEGPQSTAIAHRATGADTTYAGLPDTVVTVAIADDDQAGVDFTPASLSLSESSAGASPTSGSVAVTLRSRPTAPVTIALAPDAQIQAAPVSLTFTPGTWDNPQTVTLTAVNDLVDETTPHTGNLALTLSSADTFYDQRSVPPFAAMIEDDDTAAIVVSAATGPATSEAGGSVSFTVRLNSQPLTPVLLSPLVDLPAEATASPAGPIEFTAANWDSPVTVTVTGNDDDAFDGFVPFTVTFSARGDTAYAALPAAAIPSIALVNADDEPALVAIDDPSPPLRERDRGVQALRFPITLRRASPVSVSVSYETYDLSATGGEDYMATAGVLEIPAGETAAAIDVLVIGDEDYEADELFAVRIIAVTAPGDTAAVGDAGAVGQIRDDDQPSVRFGAADTLVREDVGATEVAVRLDAALAAPVTVQYATIDGGALAGSAAAGLDYLSRSGTLTFAPGETLKTITLSILDDDTAADEPYEAVRLSLFNPSGVTVGSPGVASVTIVEDGYESPLGGAPFLSTAGPDASTTDGYGYTAASAGGGSNFVQMSVPCDWPPGQPLTIELWSAALHTAAGSFDEAFGPAAALPAGPTTFELYGPGVAAGSGGLAPAPGAAGSLVARIYPADSGAEGWSPFHTLADPAPCGRYLLRSAASGSDENLWAVRAAGAPAVSFARLLSTVEQDSAAGTQICSTTWLAVPEGTEELRLRTYDLDAGRGTDPLAAITYYGPEEPFDPRGRLGGLAGMASGESVWAEDSVARPAAGWWRAVACTSGRNRFIVEAAADGALLPLYGTPPPAAPSVRASIAVTPDVAAPGAPITVGAGYVAAGTAVARDVTLTIALPPELVFVGDPCAATALPCSARPDSVTVAAGSLGPGQGGSLSFAATARAGAAGQLAAPRLTVSFRDGLGNGLSARAAAAFQLR